MVRTNCRDFSVRCFKMPGQCPRSPCSMIAQARLSSLATNCENSAWLLSWLTYTLVYSSRPIQHATRYAMRGVILRAWLSPHLAVRSFVPSVPYQAQEIRLTDIATPRSTILVCRRRPRDSWRNTRPALASTPSWRHCIASRHTGANL